MSREGQTLTTQRIDVSTISLAAPYLTLSGIPTDNSIPQQTSPIHANIKSSGSQVMGNVQSLEGEGETDPTRRYNNAFQHSHDGAVNNIVDCTSIGVSAVSPGSPIHRDIWDTRKLRDDEDARGTQHGNLVLNNMSRKRPRSPSPSERMIPTGPRISNGMKLPPQDPRDYTINGRVPPTGPRGGFIPRRPSPDADRRDSRDDPRNRGIFRRDRSPEGNGYHEYRGGNRRQDGEDRLSSAKRDSYRPGYSNTDTRRYSTGRERGYRDSSRSPPPRRDLPDQATKGTASTRPNAPSRQSTRDNTSQEGSERSLSPHTRARIVADDINQRMIQQRKTGLNRISRSDTSSLRRRSDAEATPTEGLFPPRKLSNGSEPIRSPLSHHSSERDERAAPANEKPRVQNYDDSSMTRNNGPTPSPAPALTTNAPRSVLQTGIGESDYNHEQPTTERHLIQPTILVAAPNPPTLPPKPLVIQSPNLSYESRYRVISSPPRPQEVLNLQTPIDDSASVNSDVILETLKSTSSVSSASVTSSEMKSKRCHVCKGDKFSEYDAGIACSSCGRHFHLRCEQQATSGDTSQEGIWKCTRCAKKSRPSSTFIAMPHRTSISSILNSSSRQSSVSLGRKSILPSADTEPPQKKLKTANGDAGINMQAISGQGDGHRPALSPTENTVTSLCEEGPRDNGYTHAPQNQGGKFRLDSWRSLEDDEAQTGPDVAREPTSLIEAHPNADPLVPIVLQPQANPIDQTVQATVPGSPELGSNPLGQLAPRDNQSLTIAYITSAHPCLASQNQEGRQLDVEAAASKTSLTNGNSLVEKPMTPSSPVANMGSHTPTIPATPDRPSVQRASPQLPQASMTMNRLNTPSNIVISGPSEPNANSPPSSQVVIGSLQAVTSAPAKADDELSDTSMSIDSAPSQSPVWKDTYQSTTQSDESSPPYSPRLDAFGHSEQSSGSAAADSVTQQSGAPSANEQGGSSSNVPIIEAVTTLKKPASSIQKCLGCGKAVLKGSVGEVSNVLCGNCTNGGSTQGKSSSGARTVVFELGPPTATPGLYLPRSNSYISAAAAVRRRPEPDPLLRTKRKAVARKVAATPQRSIEPKPIPAPRPVMRKANELRAPEKNKQQTLHEPIAEPAIPNSPEATASDEEISDKARLVESMELNQKLQESLDKYKSSLQNYASKTSNQSKELEEKNRANKTLTNEVKKLNDYVVLLRKKIEETNKLTVENRTLHLALTEALDRYEKVVSGTVELGENLTQAEKEAQQAIQEKQQAVKERNQALHEKQKWLEEKEVLMMEIQRTSDEALHAKLQKDKALEEKQQAILAGANERQQFLRMQTLHETLQNRTAISSQQKDSEPTPAGERVAPPSPTTNKKKPTVPYADLEYGAFNPFEMYPDISVVVGDVRDVPVTTVTDPQSNPSRRFKKLRWNGILDFNRKDRRYIHRQREGLSEIRIEKAARAMVSASEREEHTPGATNGRVDETSSGEEGLDTDMTIEQSLSAPALPMPTIQDNGRLCFRDGTLGANGKLPRAKVFHRVGKIDIAGQIR